MPLFVKALPEYALLGLRVLPPAPVELRSFVARLVLLPCVPLFVKAAIVLAALNCAPAHGADPWADRVVEYVAGESVPVDSFLDVPFSNANAALGAPTRYTSEPNEFGGAVTPFQSPFRAAEVVSIGEGGHLTIAFDEPVVDHPSNPFGIDLLIFGNAFYFDASFPNGIVDGAGTEAGRVEVSQDSVNFVELPGIVPDGLFPTLGYLDVTGPFSTTRGSVPTDFTRPVDPSFDAMGLAFADIVKAYDGSGGGVGIDLAQVGLGQISTVRISNPVGSGVTPEIDAMVDVRPVPEPTSLGLVAAFVACALLRRRSKLAGTH